eukprot:14622088-Alexandrium_andersonii.AAC.1
MTKSASTPGSQATGAGATHGYGSHDQRSALAPAREVGVGALQVELVVVEDEIAPILEVELARPGREHDAL